MATVQIPFGPQGTPARSPNVSTKTIINGFVEPVEGGKVPFAIHGLPGLSPFVEFTDTPCRGGFPLGNYDYHVYGEKLYRVTAGGAKTLIGTILGSRPITWTRNQKEPHPQVAIIADSLVYVLEDDTLTEHPDLLPGVNSGEYIGGRNVFFRNDGTAVYTDLEDMLSIDSLSFFTAESSPDAGVCIKRLGNQLLLFGTESFELWGLSGDTTDEEPFVSLPGAAKRRGCLAKLSVQHFDNSVCFVNDIFQVVVLGGGYIPKVISTTAVEQDIKQAVGQETGNKELIEAFVWAEGGHEFYCLSGPGFSWEYDAATQLWHRRKSYGQDGWRGRGYVRAFDRHLIGDATSGKLYDMDFNHYDEAGEHLVLEVQSPPMHRSGFNMQWNSLTLDIENGVGTGDGEHSANPKAMLSWSDDAGRTWSPEREREIGASGQWGKQTVAIRGLGISRRQGRVFRLRLSAPVRRCIVQAWAEVEYLRAA